jgi:uncharacterized protein (TIGR02145 family)
MRRLYLLVALFLIFSDSFCQVKFTDKRDGTTYRVVNVNGKTWMAENLKFRTKTGSVYYDNDQNNAAEFGLLYDWKTAQSVCPSGWHLPSGAEFRELSDHFQQHESWQKQNGDTLSFTIQLGGLQDHEGTFSEVNESAYYWTSTEYDKTSGEYFSYLIIDNMNVIDISRKADIDDIPGTDKRDRYSVRCVKNQ